MNKSHIDYSLYLVTDRKLCNERPLDKIVEEAILGGVTIVQIREKEITSAEFYDVAIKIKSVTDKYNIPLIINDRVDIALAIDASGVHIGQEDLSCKLVREMLPKDKIIGVSAHNVKEAIKAQEEGADYVGCGAVFNTSTKQNVQILTLDELKEIKRSISIPVIAIGGISENNILKLQGSNIDGVAVISAIIGKKDCKKASNTMIDKIKLIKC